jgi:hypothetical protein
MKDVKEALEKNYPGDGTEPRTWWGHPDHKTKDN